MKRGHAEGFTLVEMLTSATILAVAVVALVTVVRTGRQLEVTDQHRRRARAIVDSCLEDSVYHYLNYADMPPVGIGAGEPESLVVIDHRDPAVEHDDLVGTLWVDIPTLHTPLTHKQVIAAVRWREPEGMDTIRMEKRVARLQ